MTSLSMGLEWTHISQYPSHTHVLKSKKTQTHTQTQSKRKKLVKSGVGLDG